MKICCLIPAYNEKGNLEPLLIKLFKVLSKLRSDYQIFLVIQGDDGSVEAVKKLKKTVAKINWVYYPSPLGIGRAYKVGFKQINREFTHVLTLDADLNHEPQSLPLFIEEMKKSKADLVIGSRFIKGGSFADRRIWKRIISLLINRLFTLILGIEAHDISSGYRLIKKRVIDDVREDLSESGYPAYMELIIRSYRRGYKISEVPINYQPRLRGISKMGKIKTFLEYLFFLPKIFFIF